MSRFSKENINKLVRVPNDTPLKTFIVKNIIALLLMEIFPIILPVLWLILSNYTFIEFPLELIGLTVTTLISLVWIYLIFFKFKQVKVNKYTIKINKPVKPFTFVFLSDLHLGKNRYSTKTRKLIKIINEINKLNLNTVVIGGDLIEHEIVSDISLLKLVKAKNKFFAYGNHDAEYLEEEKENKHPSELINKVNSTGFKTLVDDGIKIVENNQNIFFGGISDLYSKQFDINKTFSKSSLEDLRILIAHNPDVLDFIEEDDNISLILSGHNHSGQIFLPVIGAVLPMPTKRRWLTRGIFGINNKTKLFLTQGVGFNGTRLRIGTVSEICVITVTN